MTLARWLWAINALTFAVAVLLAKYVLQGRRPRVRRQRSEMIALSKSFLASRTPLDDLQQAWTGVGPLRPLDHFFPERLRAIGILCESGDAEIITLRRAVEAWVKAVNDFAELVDQGLVRPKDFVLREPDIHLKLLQEAALVEPYVWYESLVCGRGRWGYRPVQLKRILEQLRAVSRSRALVAAIDVVVDGAQRRILPEMSRWARGRGQLTSKLRSPTITTRTKRRQAALAEDLAEELKRCGYPHVEIGRYGEAVDW
jgi:hypothetical protein